MTRHELESRYPLIRPLSEEGARTYLARSATGAIVMVHFIEAPPAAWRGGILARLDALESDRRERIMEVHQVDGGGAVVTRFLAGMTSAIEEASDLDQELRDVIRDHEEAQGEGGAGD